ncbi:MAG: methylmalonyl-CoA epimerase [Thermoleophilia bacterium]|nr:methylmalonyl-CoA epimerase [Thermoleophilia bacterium]
MEIRAIDHVAMVVPDLDAALGVYERLLGATVENRETLEAQGVEAAMLRAGDARLELICPLDQESGVARFLAARGPGMHHVALQVEDVTAALDELESVGARLIDSRPRRGLGDHEVAFVHPESLHGVLVEVVSRG